MFRLPSLVIISVKLAVIFFYKLFSVGACQVVRQRASQLVRDRGGGGRSDSGRSDRNRIISIGIFEWPSDVCRGSRRTRIGH